MTQPTELDAAPMQSSYGLDWGFGAGHQVATPQAPDREPLSVRPSSSYAQYPMYMGTYASVQPPAEAS
jgi:hypothetical protein